MQEAPAIGTVQGGHMFMGGDPAQETSWRAVAAGNTYANGRSRGLTPVEQRERAEAREAARNALAVLPDLERFARINAEENSGGLMALPQVDRVVGAFDPGVSQLNEISARLTPQQREPGSGTTSDRDLALFMQAVPSVQRPRGANLALIERARAEGRRRQAYADFIDRYADERGTLSGADELFRAQVSSGAIDLAGYGAAPEQSVEGAAASTPGAAGSGPDSPIDFTTADRDDVVAAIQRGGWFRQGPDGQPYQLPPGNPEYGVQEGDQMVAPGVAMRPQDAEAALAELPIGAASGAFVRGALEQVPFGDELMAGFAGLMSGQGYDQMRQAQGALASYDRQNNGAARNIGGVAGAVAQSPLGGGAVGRFVANAPRGQAALRGLMVGGGSGAVYGAGADDGGLRDRADGAMTGGVVGGLTGGILSGAGRRVGEMMTSPPPGSRREAVQVLRDNGVSLTPGQRRGGIVKTAEDVGQRLPILGTAIRGARERSRESLNRAAGNRALDAIGEGVPADVPVGGDLVGHVQGRLGSEFDRAYSMVPEINVADPDLVAGLARIGQRKSDLPEAAVRQFENIVADRLARLEGTASGQQVGAIRSELNTLAGGYLRSPDKGQQDLGSMIAELGDELDGAISRANPEAGEILARARDGYADYIRLERASTNAGGETFAPGHLASAVKATDGTVRHGGVGRGEARLQDLSRAAGRVMPDGFGNPGTADTSAAVGLGAVTLANPPLGVTLAGGLTAAATPYFAMGRKVVETLPANASRAQLEQAASRLDDLARQDQNVIVLRDEIARRLAAVSGNAAAAAVNPRPPSARLMTTPR